MSVFLVEYLIILPQFSGGSNTDVNDFGSHSAVLSSSNSPATVGLFSFKDTVHESSIGVNYHF